MNEGGVVTCVVPLFGAFSAVAACVARVVTIRTYQSHEKCPVVVVSSCFLRRRRGGLPVKGRRAAFGWPCY